MQKIVTFWKPQGVPSKATFCLPLPPAPAGTDTTSMCIKSLKMICVMKFFHHVIAKMLTTLLHINMMVHPTVNATLIHANPQGS